MISSPGGVQGPSIMVALTILVMLRIPAFVNLRAFFMVFT